MERLAAISQDLGVCFRRLVKAPGFSIPCILLLSLALGSHLAMVGLIDVVFLRPLALPEPERLLGIYETRDGDRFHPFSYLDFEAARDQVSSVSGLAAHYSTAPLHLRLGETSEMVNGSVVSASYFSVLGVEPALGRFFTLDEDRTPGTHPVVVVSHALWRGRLGGRRDVLGTVIEVNRTALTVVGVAPRSFSGLAPGMPSDLWIPTMMAATGYRWCDALGSRSCRIFDGVGRLKPGLAASVAEAELAGLGEALQRERAEGDAVRRGLHGAPLIGFRSENGSWRGRTAGLLLLVVTLVLVVAAANLNGVLIGRGLTRRREVAVRLAMGAPRGRVVSLFVGEAFLLSVAGSLGGLLLVGWISPVLGRVFQFQAPPEASYDSMLFAYALLLCGITGLGVGWIPGLQATRLDLASAIEEGALVGARRPRLLALFVVLQIACTLVLLTATGLLSLSLQTVGGAVDVDPARVATLRLRPRLVGYDLERSRALVRRVVREIEALPGVSAVGVGQLLPLWPGYDMTFGLPGEVGPGGRPKPFAGVQAVGPGLFEALGTRLVRGRGFDSRDEGDGEPSVIINQTLANGLWPGAEAIGELLELGGARYTVVGVVRDSKYLQLVRGPGPRAFTSFWRNPERLDARIVVRTSGEASRILPDLRRIAHRADPAVPATEIWTLERRLQRDLLDTQIAGGLTAGASILAALLSASGLLAVLSLAVSRRQREIGIRRALGARRDQILSLVMRETLLLVVVALGLGSVAALGAGPVLGHLLFGVEPRDPRILGGALALLALVSIVATWWPARRAARIDPVTALRKL